LGQFDVTGNLEVALLPQLVFKLWSAAGLYVGPRLYVGGELGLRDPSVLITAPQSNQVFRVDQEIPLNATVDGGIRLSLYTGLDLKAGIAGLQPEVDPCDVQQRNSTPIACPTPYPDCLDAINWGLDNGRPTPSCNCPHQGVASFLQKVATLAETSIGGVGRIPGVRKHKRAELLVNIYQGRCGQLGGGLKTEVSYKDNIEVRYGFPGSVRIDVLDNPSPRNFTAYEYKFTQNPPALTQDQIEKIINNGPPTVNNVIEINP